MQTSTDQSRRWTEALLVAGLGVALFALCFQERLYGDGPLQLLTYRRGGATGHALHHGTVELLTGLGLGLEAAARAASYLPAGLTLGLVHRAATLAGYPLASARVAALALCLTPSAFFFGTTIEAHGLQLFGAALALLLAVWVLRPSTGPLAAALGLGLAALALATTHPMNAPAGAGLLVLTITALRRRGLAWSRLVAGAAVLALIALAAGWWMTQHYSERQGFRSGTLAATFAWRFGEAGASGLPLPLHNLLEAVVRPVAWLWLPALGGLAVLLAAPRSRALGLGLVLWWLPSVFLLAGPDFTERGAYFLVALPALALATAELHHHALQHPAARRAVLLLGLLGATLCLQLVTTWRAQSAWDQGPPEEAAGWVAGLSELSGGRGVVLVSDVHQQDWARSWCGLQADNLRLFLALPTPDLEAKARDYAAWALTAAGHGEPLWVDAAIIERAPELPPLARAVAILEQHFHFSPVAAAGFQGYRGDPTTP